MSKGLPHYAADMEFYYRRPRPEILPKMLENFSGSGILTHAENRLMVAAFFAELARNGGLKLEALEETAQKGGRNGREVLAWSAHLSGDRANQALLDRLLADGNPVFSSQLRRSPPSLAAWNAEKEPAILQMYWAAFMAAGKVEWLDRIIGIARNWAINRANGRSSGVAGEMAAASLYEFAPRHPPVAARVKKFLTGASGPDQEMLKTVLANSGVAR